MDERHSLTVYFGEEEYKEYMEYFEKRPYLKKSATTVAFIMSMINGDKSPFAVNEIPGR